MSRGFQDVGCRKRFHFRNPTPDLFHHKPSVCGITDFQPALRDNDDLIGTASGVPISQDGPAKLPQTHFSAL
jgi:hypothetical protein